MVTSVWQAPLPVASSSNGGHCVPVTSHTRNRTASTPGPAGASRQAKPGPAGLVRQDRDLPGRHRQRGCQWLAWHSRPGPGRGPRGAVDRRTEAPGPGPPFHLASQGAMTPDIPVSSAQRGGWARAAPRAPLPGSRIRRSPHSSQRLAQVTVTYHKSARSSHGSRKRVRACQPTAQTPLRRNPETAADTTAVSISAYRGPGISAVSCLDLGGHMGRGVR